MIAKSNIRNMIRRSVGLDLLRWKCCPNGLYCFNYHRIGDPDKAVFDPNVYSCTEERFHEHLKFYKENYDVICIDELLSLIDQGRPVTERLALITFDDAYIDCYNYAYPALQEHNLKASFFVPTKYIETGIMPWWDEIAWIIRQSTCSEIMLTGLLAPVIIDHDNIGQSIRLLLKEIKRNVGIRMGDRVTELKEVTGYDDSYTSKESSFVTWSMLTEMAEAGMDIGSHTHSHEILTHLSVEEQRNEIIQSKNNIESRIGTVVNSFAYPVGGDSSFNDEISSFVKSSGYKVAFTTLPGVNCLEEKERFRLFRLQVSGNCSLHELKIIASYF